MNSPLRRFEPQGQRLKPRQEEQPFHSSRAAESRVGQWVLQGHLHPESSIQHAHVSGIPFQIGRLHENDLCLPNPTVSGRHAELTTVAGDLHVKDLNSTNGTFVNGRRIKAVARLRVGDVLQFGTAKFTLRRDEVPESATVSAEVARQALAYVQFDKLVADPSVVPHFQPIVRLADSKRVAFEVLARSDLIGLETPATMFSVAAERNMECELSCLLRREGLRIGHTLDMAMQLYLNTHPAELNSPELFQSLEGLRKGVPQRPIMLEIHEAAVTSAVFLAELRKRLDDLDIGLAYDDFGAGQARLLELTEVPPDVIKFDMHLVRGLPDASSQRQRMVKSLVALARSIGATPLAEGVETSAEAAVCQQLGFELAQGFFYGRPAAAQSW